MLGGWSGMVKWTRGLALVGGRSIGKRGRGLG